MRVAIQTLGCKVNQSESASIEGILRSNNFELVKHTDNPDICIVNTCTVTAKSDYQSRQIIRKAVKSGARVIATGCYAQLRPEELSEIDGIDLIIGNSDKSRILSFIKELSKDSNGNKQLVNIDPPSFNLTEQPYYSTRSRAFLKIQDGCNSSCSYCTVPLARGKNRSLGMNDVLRSVDKLCSEGYREIVLTGIHIGFYGSDMQPECSLLDLVNKIVVRHPEIRIRLSSIEPQEFSFEFLSLMKEGAVCPHLHIPLQSGSDRILRAMNRGYTTEFFEQLINRIVTTYPDISIGTDLIAGFPGESDKDFNDTVKFINRLPLSYLHVFPFSKRPMTEASLMSDQISEEVKKSRVKQLIEIGKMKKNSYIKGNLGRILDVIVEKRNKISGYYNAISDNYIKLLVDSSNLYSGQRLRVRVISLTEHGLIAKPLE